MPLWLVGQTRTYKVPTHVSSTDYFQNRIVVKFKKGHTPSSLKSTKTSTFRSEEEYVPVKKPNPNQRGYSILDGVYYLNLNNGQDPVQLCNQLLKNEQVEYAEVLFYEQLFHTPNDPFANQTTGNQDYLQTIKAYEAWDVTTGNPNVLIGIVDTGMDIDHADLVNNYYQNFGDVVDGVDNDDNGYDDDFIGYDFADNDNNPNADTDVNSSLNHGTHVGGIAGASTNNNLGIAGVAYNCRIVPLKGFTTATVLSTGVWEGVIYAADNGYDIVNLSWGNTNGYVQFYQDIIDYCVLEKDMVVVAAAGNTNANLDFYPASYEHVISVAASTLSDTKWSSGTYGDHVDILAPGVSVFSTQKDDTYGSDSGSSHASPMVAGVAGLVKSVFPSYNARQIMEQIRVTTDDIYGITENQPYQYLLGKGRLNAERAVTETNAKSIRVQNFSYDNGYGEYAFYGDTITLQFDLINYLSKVNSPIISVESDSPYVTILSDPMEPGILQPMEPFDGATLRLILSESTPSETEINLRFFMEDGTYQDFQNFTLTTSPDYLQASSPHLALTIAGNGDLGLTDNYSEGNGFTFNGRNSGNYHGLLFGDSESRMYDNVPSAFFPEANDGDFLQTKPIKFYKHSTIGTYAYSEFRTWDSDFLIDQVVIPGESDDFILVEYRIVNKSGENLNDFHVGFFSDQDVPNGANSVSWDPGNDALVFSDEVGDVLGALAMVTTSSDYVSLNMQDFNGHSQDVGNSFSNTEKFNFLNGPNVSTAGELSGGNDVAGIVKTTFPTFPNNTEIKVGFILSAAESIEDISANLMSARDAYFAFASNPEVSQTFFSCEGGEVTLDPDGDNFDFYEDPLKANFIATGSSIQVDNITKDTAIYVQNLDQGYPARLTKIDIKILDEIAVFEPSTDTLYLDHPTVNLVRFRYESYLPTNWFWDFGNGQQSTTQNPSINYQAAGIYTVSLSVTSELGCEDTYSKDIVVATRPDTPSIQDQSICRGETLVLTHPTDEYSIFDNQGNRVLTGSEVTLGPFDQDSIIRVANRVNDFESQQQQVLISVDPILASYQIYPDTLSDATSALLRFTGTNASNYEWKIDGNIVSTESEFTYAVSADFTLDLAVNNEDCSASLSESVVLTSSPIPSIGDIQACDGEPLVIQPKNGTYFGFYSDQNLTQLIHKGKQLLIESLTVSTSIFVVGLDNVLPSTAKMVSIDVVDFESAILATPSVLDLTISSIAQFSAEGITEAKWYVDGQLVETALNPILFFDAAGEYEIRLEGANSAGCSIMETLIYEVRDITLGVSNDDFKIYPNPVDASFTLHDKSLEKSSLVMFDLEGKEIYRMENLTGTSIEVVTSSIPPGLVVVKLIKPDETKEFKLLIKH
ncbi:MAG: S8 family serine peptidase [Cyclobacteriaceae bacterium]